MSGARQAELKPLVDKMLTRARVFEQKCGIILEFQSLVDSLQQAFDRLDYPSTKLNLIVQFACVQRYWLLADAWLEFNVHLYGYYSFSDPQTRERKSLRTDLMGAFTENPDVVQNMFKKGVPVWLLRDPEQLRGDEVILKYVDICQPDFSQDCSPFLPDPIYIGWAGKNHLFAIAQHANSYKERI